ncbi:hypothetical protein DSECCO2_477730 [anaerobic digester metagenome]
MAPAEPPSVSVCARLLVKVEPVTVRLVTASPTAMFPMAPASPPILVERAWFSLKSQLVMVMVVSGRSMVSMNPRPPTPRFSMAPAAPPVSSAWARLPVKVVSVRVTVPRMLTRAPATPPVSSVT